MKALIEKELRLMLPAFCAAMALAIVPVWFPTSDATSNAVIRGWLCMFGTVMLALSVFGREAGLRTLPFIMSQPLERKRIWWTKIAVLGVLAALVFDAWWLSTSLDSIAHPAAPPLYGNLLIFWAALMAGGLWMTLLLRQVIAAFWLNILVVGAITAGIEIVGGPNWLIFTALALYAVAAFVLALRQFQQLQDTAWTGGLISFGGKGSMSDRPSARGRRPWVALIAKEFQVQQITLAGIICLAVLHAGVLVVRTIGANSLSKLTLLALSGFGFLWFVVPVLAGSQSVAEERQLGTLEPILCLPVSRKIQFAVKMIFVAVIGGLVSAAMFAGIEKLGRFIGLQGDLSMPGIFVVIAFVALSIMGVYASSLTRGIVPALGVAVVTVAGFWACLRYPTHPVADFGFKFFEGTLWTFLGIPLVLGALTWLAYRNFGSVSEDGRLWRRSVVTLAVTLAATFVLTTAVYHRVWELVGPLEAAHGAARIPSAREGAAALRMRSYGFGLAALLPDGRLWNDRIFDEPRWDFLGTGLGDKWRSVYGNAFVPGSNWVDAAATSSETAAIKSDGTLWVSERPQDEETARPYARLIHWAKPASLVQLGHDNDWQSLAVRGYSRVLVLKKNGSLWELGTNYWAMGYPSLRDHEPRRIGTDSDWATLMKIDGNGAPLLLKKDGTAWALRGADFGNVIIRGVKVIEMSADFSQPSVRPPLVPGGKPQSVVTRIYNPGNAVEPLPGLDGLRVRCATTAPDYLGIVFVRDDHTLWFWDWNAHRLAGKSGPPRVQIGKDADWADFVSSFYSMVARKTDGTLWKWDYDPAKHDPLATLEKAPVRLSAHSDWVGLVAVGWRTISLAADGSLWMWPWPEEEDFTSGGKGTRLGIFLTPSRKPEQIENIFGGKQ